jgi:xanthine/CO dehydrogenase XdhC/CoxF family maturation factor
VKNVGSKLDTKLKSGDMKESELLQEASDIMQKMKSMPGMGDLQSMLAKMGMGHMMPGGAGGGAKVNVNAMKANLDRNLKAAKNKERLLAKLEKNKQDAQAANLKSTGVDTAGRENLVFSKGEQVERSVKPGPGAACTGTGTGTEGTGTGAGTGTADHPPGKNKHKNRKKKNKNKNTETTTETTTE